jgi:NAD(P)-dependent dehydrogenase (short-subunit alcohol dehydrogenase family)
LSTEKRIVITGGTRGLGRALAAAFLAEGAHVFITGRTEKSVSAALAELARGAPADAIGGGIGDVGNAADLGRLAAEAGAFLGGVDHWINNAGVNQVSGKILDLEPAEMERVLRTNLLGPLYGAKAARALVEESGGFVWFMEGHGSNGQIMDGLSLYGTSKRGVNYLWQALAVECERTRIKIGALSPGIMVTDFILKNREAEGEERWKRNAKVFNILADRPETVASFFVPRILAAKKNGTKLVWLTPKKAAFRFLTAGITHRKVLE